MCTIRTKNYQGIILFLIDLDIMTFPVLIRAMLTFKSNKKVLFTNIFSKMRMTIRTDSLSKLQVILIHIHQDRHLI